MNKESKERSAPVVSWKLTLAAVAAGYTAAHAAGLSNEWSLAVGVGGAAGLKFLDWVSTPTSTTPTDHLDQSHP